MPGLSRRHVYFACWLTWPFKIKPFITIRSHWKEAVVFILGHPVMVAYMKQNGVHNPLTNDIANEKGIDNE